MGSIAGNRCAADLGILLVVGVVVGWSFEVKSGLSMEVGYWVYHCLRFVALGVDLRYMRVLILMVY